MPLSRIVRFTASLAALTTSGAMLAGCGGGPPPPMDIETPPPNEDVIPVTGDSSGSPDAPAPPNEDVIPINGDSSTPPTAPPATNDDIIPIAGDSSGPAAAPPPPSGAAMSAAASSITSLSAAGLAVLTAHNAERASVGAPPLRWNAQLAKDAADYAQQLALKGQLVHAPREGRGIERENLSEGNSWWTTSQMVDSWVNEKRFFHPGTFPDVCNGDWTKCAHYSQMIWPTTTDIGCGEASGSGHKWLVCRYSPGGNKDGKAVGAAPR